MLVDVSGDVKAREQDCEDERVAKAERLPGDEVVQKEGLTREEGRQPKRLCRGKGCEELKALPRAT